MTSPTTIPLGDVDTRTGIVERWLKAALFNDAHVWVGQVNRYQRNRTVMVKAFGGATAEALRVNLYSDTGEVTVDAVGTWQSTGPMDALTAMSYVADRIRK